MILLIDNYDSFTYNLFQLIESLQFPVKVIVNDAVSLEDIKQLNPAKIVISPGPKTPEFTGICIPVIRAFYQSVPIMGICLGHQCIGSAFGAKTIQAKQLIHGQAMDVFHQSSRLFETLPNPFPAARYNSLVIDRTPSEFNETGWDINHDIMAIEHKEFDLYGVQFHPESFMTEGGKTIMQKFLHV